jgi:hypothetical protein
MSKKWVWNSRFVLHDNTPAHWSLVVKQYLTKHNVAGLEHPPYSPEVTPNFFLSLQLKRVVKGQCFMSTEKVTAKAMRILIEVLKMVSRTTSKKFTNIGQIVTLPKGRAGSRAYVLKYQLNQITNLNPVYSHYTSMTVYVHRGLSHEFFHLYF